MINKKVIIAMSGGVDSSVAASLLSREYKDLLGIFLHFWKDDKVPVEYAGVENKCCSTEALFSARQVCRALGIKLYDINFSREFKKDVVDDFLTEYARGNTPNPCVRCNKFVKLGLLIKRACELGYDYVASGHYARIKRVETKFPKGNLVSYRLFRGKDKNKDQSYFLYRLTQEQLKHLLFPLGEYTKDEVRKIARVFGLSVAEKKESQEICFIPGKSHNEFLKRYLKLKKGPILTPLPTASPLSFRCRATNAAHANLIRRGRKTEDASRMGVIGEHQGLPLYTIGQRKGVEIGGTGPYYVSGVDYKTNALYVVSDNDNPALFRDRLIAYDINWISGIEHRMPLKCEAVIRYRHSPVKCEARKAKDEAGKYEIMFKEPQRAVTPGQSVVFYDGDEVLGGGIISHNL